MPARRDDEDSYESVSEEERPPSPAAPAAVAKVAPAPPASSRTRGASVAPAVAPPMPGRKKRDEESSDSVSEAPGRREVPTHFDSDVSSSPAKPAGSRPTSPDRRHYGERWWRGNGRWKHWGTQDCPICWNEVGTSQSALEQHQRTNLTCLQWQRYNRGGVSWNDAKVSAVRRKARREARAIAASARVPLPPEDEKDEKPGHGKADKEEGHKTPSSEDAAASASGHA